MEAQKYRVVTTGEIYAGFTRQEVKNNLLGLCKGDKDQLERIFSGNHFVFVSDVELIAARRHKTSLQQTGIVCQIEPLSPITSSEKHNNQFPSPPIENNELPRCPKCNAVYNGETICAACGIVPNKYLDRQKLNQQVAQNSVVVYSDRFLAIRIIILLIIGCMSITAAYINREAITTKTKDWIIRRNAPNFELTTTEIPDRSKSEIIREFQLQGFALDCYGNLNKIEKPYESIDYICWVPINSAYDNIPAKVAVFFFSGEELKQIRLDFPYESSDRVLDYLKIRMVKKQRLDTLPEYRNMTNIYGVPLVVWKVAGGVFVANARPTQNQIFTVHWLNIKITE